MDEGRGIFEALLELCTGERLDESIRNDENCIRVNQEYMEMFHEYEALEVPEEQRELVRKLLDMYAEKLSCYSELAYIQGMHDAVDLLKGMGVL